MVKSVWMCYTTAAGLLFAFSTVEMSLSAWLISKYNSTDDYNYVALSERTRVRYALFISIWTMVFSGAYFIMALGAMMGGFGTVASHLFFLAVGWIMWLGAAISISHFLGGALSCSSAQIVHCGQLNALQAFAWLILYVAFNVFVPVPQISITFKRAS